MSRDRWLVAAWPGMGSVGTIAAWHLVPESARPEVLRLDSSPGDEEPPLEVHAGLAREGVPPRTTFHAVPGRAAGAPDLVVVVGAQAPRSRMRERADAVLDAAAAFDVSRVVTFAALAAAVDPSSRPRVHAASTTWSGVAEAVRCGATALEEADVVGMNGALVAAAARRGLPGLCLLGEFPAFAAGLLQPRAAAEVLRVFSCLTGDALDLSALERRAVRAETRAAEALEGLAREAGEEGSGETAPAPAPPERVPSPPRGPVPETLSAADVARLERLFAEAGGDRSKALALKAELDRLGAFGRYKDRFLDLFRRAE